MQSAPQASGKLFIKTLKLNLELDQWVGKTGMVDKAAVNLGKQDLECRFGSEGWEQGEIFCGQNRLKISERHRLCLLHCWTDSPALQLELT